MLCCKPAITFTLIAHVCSICTPPITLSQKHSETYDTCTSGRKVFPQSAATLCWQRARCSSSSRSLNQHWWSTHLARKSQMPRDLRSTPHVYSATTTTVQPKRRSPESPFRAESSVLSLSRSYLMFRRALYI